MYFRLLYLSDSNSSFGVDNSNQTPRIIPDDVIQSDPYYADYEQFSSMQITQIAMSFDMVWGTPVLRYKQKKGIRVMFWSGADFDEETLNVLGKKFKDASIFYNTVSEINIKDLKRWLDKSEKIQWDYKNIVKRKGKLERLK
jgi:hypothetical protein